MKLRILNSSFRFRISPEELRDLAATGTAVSEGCIPPSGAETTFRYGIQVDPGAEQGFLRLQPFSIMLVLSPAELATLRDPDREGVYLRREWTDANGLPARSMAFVEKDRPASRCEKPEAWVFGAEGS